MTTRHVPALLIATMLLLGACTTGTPEPSESPTEPTTEPSGTTTSEPTETATSEPPATLEQPAVWPAADVVLATPEEAATAFGELRSDPKAWEAEQDERHLWDATLTDGQQKR